MSWVYSGENPEDPCSTSTQMWEKEHHHTNLKNSRFSIGFVKSVALVTLEFVYYRMLYFFSFFANKCFINININFK